MQVQYLRKTAKAINRRQSGKLTEGERIRADYL